MSIFTTYGARVARWRQLRAGSADRQRLDHGLARLAELTAQAQLLDAQITEQVEAPAAVATPLPVGDAILDAS